MTDQVPDALDALRAALDRIPSRAGAATARAELTDPLAPLAPEVDALDSARLAELAGRAAELGRWRQGPFLLHPDLILGASGRDRERWLELGRHVATDLAGLRALVVGCGAGYDAFAFAARNAEHVLACEPTEEIDQAELVDSVYSSGIHLRRCGWEDLDPAHDGTFDLVYCDGLLHRTPEPVALLQALRRMSAPGGTLLIGSMLQADPERSEHLRYVPDGHTGDPSWWFVPGRLAFRWLVQAAGYEVLTELGEREGPRYGFPVVSGYLMARTADEVRTTAPAFQDRDLR